MALEGESRDLMFNFDKQAALGPYQPPALGEILVSQRRYVTAQEILIQQRYGVWFFKDLALPGSSWEPKLYYVSWRMFWLQYSPLYKVRLEQIPIEDLDEFLELISWAPADI